MGPKEPSRGRLVTRDAFREPAPTIDPVDDALRAEIKQASCATECVERGEHAALTPLCRDRDYAACSAALPRKMRFGFL
jgi:hypothetical protein